MEFYTKEKHMNSTAAIFVAQLVFANQQALPVEQFPVLFSIGVLFAVASMFAYTVYSDAEKRNAKL